MTDTARKKIRRKKELDDMGKIEEIESRQSEMSLVLIEIQGSMALIQNDVGHIKENQAKQIDDNSDKIKTVSKLSVKNKDKINMVIYLFTGAVGLGTFIIAMIELTKNI